MSSFIRSLFVCWGAIVFRSHRCLPLAWAVFCGSVRCSCVSIGGFFSPLEMLPRFKLDFKDEACGACCALWPGNIRRIDRAGQSDHQYDFWPTSLVTCSVRCFTYGDALIESNGCGCGLGTSWLPSLSKLTRRAHPGLIRGCSTGCSGSRCCLPSRLAGAALRLTRVAARYPPCFISTALVSAELTRRRGPMG